MIIGELYLFEILSILTTSAPNNPFDQQAFPSHCWAPSTSRVEDGPSNAQPTAAMFQASRRKGPNFPGSHQILHRSHWPEQCLASQAVEVTRVRGTAVKGECKAHAAEGHLGTQVPDSGTFHLLLPVSDIPVISLKSLHINLHD